MFVKRYRTCRKNTTCPQNKRSNYDWKTRIADVCRNTNVSRHARTANHDKSGFALGERKKKDVRPNLTDVNPGQQYCHHLYTYSRN